MVIEKFFEFTETKEMNVFLAYNKGKTRVFKMSNGWRVFVGDNPTNPASMPESILFKALEEDPVCKGLFQPSKKVNTFKVDFLWNRGKLIVEVDGYAYHRSKERFEKDRDRDYKLFMEGYAVLRFTASAVIDNPAEVVSKIKAAVQKLQADRKLITREMTLSKHRKKLYGAAKQARIDKLIRQGFKLE